MHRGYIKLYRKSFDHWLYNEKRPLTMREAWEDMLLICNHSEEKIRLGDELFICRRGESLNSLDTWARLFKWNKSKVRRFFKLLENDSMIVIKNVKKSTHLTICNYGLYQDTRNANETQMKRERNADETQMTPNNKYKNDKNDKNDKNIDSNSYCPKPSSQKSYRPEEIAFSFECNGAEKEYHVTHDDCVMYKGLYPGVDIIQTMREIKGWVISNPTKRKTFRGMPRFINAWLSREQNR